MAGDRQAQTSDDKNDLWDSGSYDSYTVFEKEVLDIQAKQLPWYEGPWWRYFREIIPCILILFIGIGVMIVFICASVHFWTSVGKQKQIAREGMLLDELNGAEPEWTEDEMKMYMQGVEDNTTVAIFSIKVYYSIEVGEGSSRHFPLSSGKLADMVDRMIDRLNKRFEDLGALTKAKLHCLEQMTWSENEVLERYGKFTGNRFYKHRDRNSADAVLFITTAGGCGGLGVIGKGLSGSFTHFGASLVSWAQLVCVDYGYNDDLFRSLGNNLGLSHTKMESLYGNPGLSHRRENDTYYVGRAIKEFRFALAAVGDESEPCPKQEADWEFRSQCFKSFGKYAGAELENETRTPADSAKACQNHCAATDGCSFFSFKEAGAPCQMSSKAAEQTYAQGIIGGSVTCDPDEEAAVDMSSCATSGGTANGAPCSFPFEYWGFAPDAWGLRYRGGTYLNCISAGHSQDWCYTVNGKWGNCNSTCKGGVLGCFTTNVIYSPVDDFPGARWSMQTSAEACKARCKLHPECGHFSFWAKDLPYDNGCTLFGASAVFGHEKETNDIITGPATCPDLERREQKRK